MVRNNCAGDHGLAGPGSGDEDAQFVVAERLKRSLLILPKLECRCEFDLLGIGTTLVNHQSASRLRDHTGCLLGKTSRK